VSAKIERTFEGYPRGPVMDIRGDAFDPDLRVDLTLKGAELRKLHGSRFDVSVRYPFEATDFEHSGSSLAWFEGVGLDWTSMSGSHMSFEAILTRARFYDVGQSFEIGTEFPHSHDDPVARWCDYENCQGERAHRIMPYLPPDVAWWPATVEVRMDLSWRHLTKETT